MFWGLIMEPQRRYTQQVKKAFHISMAALDVSTSSDEPAQVMCGFEGRNYLLCTLQKPDMLQCPLDLNFDVGNEVSFAANGKCHVHLTGYLTDELLDTTEEEVEEEQEPEVTTKNKKRMKNAFENGPPNKKTKKGTQVSSSQGELVESDSEDSDLDINALLEGSLPESDDDSDAVVEEEDDEEDNEEEEDDEEDGDEEESSLSEEEHEIELEKPKGKVNGLSKKQEQLEKANVKANEINRKENKNKKSAKNKETDENKSPNKNTQTVKKRTLQGGVIVEDLKDGNGTPAKGGRFVNVYYEGRLKQNNKLFDAATKGSGFSFRLGSGEVIKGWDVGILGMKAGGKRRIICPPAMAYGQKGSPPAIPPNSTLVFEVELKKVS